MGGAGCRDGRRGQRTREHDPPREVQEVAGGRHGVAAAAGRRGPQQGAGEVAPGRRPRVVGVQVVEVACRRRRRPSRRSRSPPPREPPREPPRDSVSTWQASRGGLMRRGARLCLRFCPSDCSLPVRGSASGGVRLLPARDSASGLPRVRHGGRHRSRGSTYGRAERLLARHRCGNPDGIAQGCAQGRNDAWRGLLQRRARAQKSRAPVSAQPPNRYSRPPAAASAWYARGTGAPPAAAAAGDRSAQAPLAGSQARRSPRNTVGPWPPKRYSLPPAAARPPKALAAGAAGSAGADAAAAAAAAARERSSHSALDVLNTQRSARRPAASVGASRRRRRITSAHHVGASRPRRRITAASAHHVGESRPRRRIREAAGRPF